MKLRLTIFALCFLAVAGAALAFASGVGEEETVTVTAETLSGDPSAAKDFVGHLTARDGYEMSWTIDFPLDDPASAQSAFASYQELLLITQENAELNMDLGSYLTYYSRQYGGGTLPAVLRKAAEALGEDLEPGGTLTTRIRLADYLDNLPVSGNSYTEQDNWYRELSSDDLTPLLDLAVPENFYGDVTMSKDSQGRVDYFSLELMNPTSPTGETEASEQTQAAVERTVSALAGDRVYFALAPYPDTEGSIWVDVSPYQISPGIYWMERAEEGTDIPMGTLGTYPAGTKILALAANWDTLYEAHSQGEDVTVAAWDLTTGEKVSELSLGNLTSDTDPSRWTVEQLSAGDYGLLAMGEGQVALLTQDEAGVLSVVFQSRDEAFSLPDPSAVWELEICQEGERISILTSTQNYDDDSLTAWVYDRTGDLLYQGRYTFSCQADNWTGRLPHHRPAPLLQRSDPYKQLKPTE